MLYVSSLLLQYQFYATTSVQYSAAGTALLTYVYSIEMYMFSLNAR